MKHPILRKSACLLAFAAVTAVLLALCDFLLTDDVHSYSRVMLQELYAGAGQIDTLFLGSSHCYRSVDPAAVNERLGVSSFNAGTSQQLPDGSYYLLREAAEENDLKTVYLEMFYTGYNSESSASVPMACYLITDYLRPTSPNRYRYLWEMGGPAALADLLLPARHTIADPGELPGLWRTKLTDGYEPGNYEYVTYPDEGEAYYGSGFVYTWGTPGYGFNTVMDLDAEAPLSDFGREYLTRIADLCTERGIRLVLFTAPLPGAYAADTANYQAYVDAVRAFAAERGLEYWDFTLYKDNTALDMQVEDYADAHHLNGQGAEKFTAVFCDVAARRAGGEDVAPLFFDTLAEKLREAPDATVGQDG